MRVISLLSSGQKREKAVLTRWVLPPKSLSMDRASDWFFGFPKILPLQSTIVSAAKMIIPFCFRALNLSKAFLFFSLTILCKFSWRVRFSLNDSDELDG